MRLLLPLPLLSGLTASGVAGEKVITRSRWRAGGTGSSHSPRSTDGVEKTGELDHPVSASVIAVYRQPSQPPGMATVKLRVKNPNRYALLYHARNFRIPTISVHFHTLKQGQWTFYGGALCGTGILERTLPAGGLVELLFLRPPLAEQRALATFYREDQPAIQSECVLYEPTLPQ